MGVEIGVSSLSDLQPPTDPAARMAQIVELGVAADEAGLDVFAVGEHHSEDFLVSSPVPVLSTVAARTRNIRLATGVTVLSVHDPVRVWQDFATLDLISDGRAEITVGRSAYPDPFALFGIDIRRYDEVFAERLGLLLRLRDGEPHPRTGQVVPPRPVQRELPVWIGAGGSPGSVLRAAALGLPLILGYIGGTGDDLRRLVDVYRAAGGTRVGVAVHLFAAADTREAESTYPHYRDFLRPKRPGSPGFVVEPRTFAEGLKPGRHLMIGTSEQVTEKLLALHAIIGYDRVQALVDWGGLPARQVSDSLYRLGTEIAPAVRAEAPI